ncbi:MAG: hypothetical protein GEU96_07025 [Propionibacteriales bacterium]|nr:hypothetical protein [Propionibacteriales bacterium]
MTTKAVSPTPTASVRETSGPVRRTPAALAVRRWFLIASPVLAGLFAVVGAYADPAVGLDGRQLYELYAENPDPLQFKSLGFHWSYAFWIAPALLLAGYVRGRGAWLANIAAVLGFAGMTTLPGLLFIDYYDSAIGQLYGPEAAAAVNEHMGATMWGLVVFVTPGIVGLLVALPLAAVALWRSGLVRWWAPVAVLGGTAAFMFSSVTWWGCAITTACFTVFAVAIAKATSPLATNAQ